MLSATLCHKFYLKIVRKKKYNWFPSTLCIIQQLGFLPSILRKRLWRYLSRRFQFLKDNACFVEIPQVFFQTVSGPHQVHTRPFCQGSGQSLLGSLVHSYRRRSGSTRGAGLSETLHRTVRRVECCFCLCRGRVGNEKHFVDDTETRSTRNHDKTPRINQDCFLLSLGGDQQG